MYYPGGPSKESACSAGDADVDSIPGSGKSPGGGNGKPTPVFLPGKSHGQRSLEGHSPWGITESDTAEHAEHVCIASAEKVH